MNHAKTPSSGFTFIEIIITIAIAAILSVLAISSYSKYIANNQADILATELNATLHLAKTTSYERALSVKVCALASSGGSTCNDTASSWQFGWQVVVVPTGEIVFVYRPKDGSGVTNSASASITYSPSGIPTPTSATFTIKPTQCSSGYTISYNVTTAGGSLATTPVACP